MCFAVDSVKSYLGCLLLVIPGRCCQKLLLWLVMKNWRLWFCIILLGFSFFHFFMLSWFLLWVDGGVSFHSATFCQVECQCCVYLSRLLCWFGIVRCNSNSVWCGQNFIYIGSIHWSIFIFCFCIWVRVPLVPFIQYIFCLKKKYLRNKLNRENFHGASEDLTVLVQLCYGQYIIISAFNVVKSKSLLF